MADEQIKQNAFEYSLQNCCVYDDNGANDMDSIREAYFDGAHSRDEEIEQLKKAISSAQKAMAELAEMARNPWISVEKQLPEKTKGIFSCQVRELEEDKIVYYKDTRGYIHTGYLNARNNWRDLDRDNAAIYPVTHWMPIPKTPKEEEI